MNSSSEVDCPEIKQPIFSFPYFLILLLIKLLTSDGVDSKSNSTNFPSTLI